jgi:predicted nucleotidyltransferase
MIPELVDIGASWKVLPLGVHDATLEEVEKYFATNKKRKQLFLGFVRACKALKAAGCETVYLDGSYVTGKDFPSDYDVCWNPRHVDSKKLDPVFLDFSNKRKKQKLKYGGEFFLSSAKADGSHLFIKYFQTDKETGQEKGIIRINL